MNLVQITLDVGGFLLIIASLPLMQTIYKNKKKLIGFNKIGTPLTAIANYIFVLTGIFSGALVLLISAILNSILWTLASIYILKKFEAKK